MSLTAQIKKGNFSIDVKDIPYKTRIFDIPHKNIKYNIKYKAEFSQNVQARPTPRAADD
jgi:hypothetical protein